MCSLCTILQETCLATNLQVSLKDIAKIQNNFSTRKCFMVFLYLFNLYLPIIFLYYMH
nr:MAG TPA: hypothetical protein [Caudoviricetes sp.]